MDSVIKKKRLEKNMTLEDVGNLVGVGKSTVRKWENGMIENMGRDKIVLLSKALDISPLEILGMEEKPSTIDAIYNQLTPQRQTKVYDFASYQLKEQNRKPTITIKICGYVSAGTGEWLEENQEEIEYSGDIPQHDFAVRVNGDSMLPLFEDGQVIFVNGSSEARDGQIIVCRVNSDAYVKKLSGNKLVSLNKDYSDILISDTDDFKIFGVVVL